MLRQVNDDQTTGFILGAPFFRNVTIEINYLTSAISIWSKEVSSPINPDSKYPPYDESKQAIIDQYWLANGQYYGEGYIGTPLQGTGNNWAYSSTSYYTVVPESGVVYNGWYDSSASSTYSSDGLDT